MDCPTTSASGTYRCLTICPVDINEMHIGQSGAGCGGQCGHARHAGHAGHQAGHAGGSRVLYFWRRRPPQCAHSAGRPAREPRRRGVPSSSSTRTFSHCASSVCARVCCPEAAAAPRVFGGRGMLGGGRQIPPQPNLRGTAACDNFENFTLGSVTFICFEI